MAGVDVQCVVVGPEVVWAESLSAWMNASGISRERSTRAEFAFGRFSAWVAARGLGAADVDEDLVDEYIEAERKRSGSPVPAAAQYLPLVKRFLAAEGVLVLRPPVSRRRYGRPRLEGGPLGQAVLDLVVWLSEQGYACGTASSVACTAARLSVWMGRRGLDVEDLDDTVLARFVAAQSRGKRSHSSSARRIVTVRRFFVATGMLTPARALPAPVSPVGEVLTDWTSYLLSLDPWMGIEVEAAWHQL